MIGKWVDGPQYELTDEFIRKELGKYLFSSIQKSGPIYSASVLPNYYEDLDEINPDNFEEIRQIIKKHYDLILSEDLNDIVEEFVKMKGLYSTTLTPNKDISKDELAEVKEDAEKRKASGEIDDFKITPSGALTIFHNIEGMVKELKEKSFREEFVNFDYDFDDRVAEVSKVAELIDGNLQMEYSDLADGKLELNLDYDPNKEGHSGFKFTYFIPGNPQKNLDFFEEINANEFMDITSRGKLESRKNQIVKLDEFKISAKLFAQLRTNEATSRKFIKTNFIDDLSHYLKNNEFALDPSLVNDITVEGRVLYDSENLYPTLTIKTDTVSAFKFLETKNIARSPKKRQSKISGGKGHKEKWERQFHPKTYNKDRDKFASHVVGRMTRLEEAW